MSASEDVVCLGVVVPNGILVASSGSVVVGPVVGPRKGSGAVLLDRTVSAAEDVAWLRVVVPNGIQAASFRSVVVGLVVGPR